MESADLKRAIASYAADALIRDGMKLGLGTGTTAIWLVARLAELLRSKKISTVFAVATSPTTKMECEKLGIPLTSLTDPVLGGSLDLTIDGADEIDPERRLLKGGGGALLLEKIVAYASKTYAVIAEERKLVRRLGETFPVPIEVIPAASAFVKRNLGSLGAQKIETRAAKGFAGPVYTEHGNVIIDAVFPAIDDPAGLEQKLKQIPGIVESGLFTRPVDHLIIGLPDGRIDHQ